MNDGALVRRFPLRLGLLGLLLSFLLSACRERVPERMPQRAERDVDELIAVLATGEPGEECEEALREVIGRGPTVVPRLARALGELPPDQDGSWLGEALFGFGREAAPAGDVVLSRLLLGTETAWVMAAVLDVSGPEGQKRLLLALRPDAPDTCLIATLTKVEAESESAVTAVSKLVNHPNAAVRDEALARLGESGKLGRIHLGLVRAAFAGPSQDVRRRAVESASSLAEPGDVETAKGLARILQQETDRRVLLGALEATGKIQVATGPIRKGLERTATSADEEVRDQALEMLKQLFPN